MKIFLSQLSKFQFFLGKVILIDRNYLIYFLSELLAMKTAIVQLRLPEIKVFRCIFIVVLVFRYYMENCWQLFFGRAWS